MAITLPIDIPFLFSLVIQVLLSILSRILVCFLSYLLKKFSPNVPLASPFRNHKRGPVTLADPITLQSTIWAFFEIFLLHVDSWKASLAHCVRFGLGGRTNLGRHSKAFLSFLYRCAAELDNYFGRRIEFILHNIHNALVRAEKSTDVTVHCNISVNSTPTSSVTTSSDGSTKFTALLRSSSFTIDESSTPPKITVDILSPFICTISPASPTASTPASPCLSSDTPSSTPSLLAPEALTLVNDECGDEKFRPVSTPAPDQRQPLAPIAIPRATVKIRSKSMPERSIQTSSHAEKENTPPKSRTHAKGERLKRGRQHDQVDDISDGSFMAALRVDAEPIGEGGFGQVFRATGIGNKPIAVKLMQRGVVTQEVAITNEVHALKIAKGSRWVVDLVYFLEMEDQALIALTYLPGGDMHGYWEHCAYRVDLESARFYTAQLILAIHDLHTRGILHRDIKLENMMFDSHCNLKLVDFGLSQVFDHTSVSKRRYPLFHELRKLGGDSFPLLWPTQHNPHQTDVTNGTEGYAPPEVWRSQWHSFGIDYFAMGCVFHALITGGPPFEPNELLEDYDYTAVYVDQNINPDAYDFLISVLADRPTDRLSVSRMKKHPVFRGINWDVLAIGGIEPPCDPRRLH